MTGRELFERNEAEEEKQKNRAQQNAQSRMKNRVESRTENQAKNRAKEDEEETTSAYSRRGTENSSGRSCKSSAYDRTEER